MAHTWTSLGHLPTILAGTPFTPDTMLLLSDGSVLVHQRMNEHLTALTGMEWFRLRPDGRGKYETGTWSGPFSMRAARQYFSSGMLRDGRVFVLGGEYSTTVTFPKGISAPDTPTAEIFDPSTNTWSDIAKPAAFDWVRRDAPACVLADGRVLFGASWTNQSALWDPATGDWHEAGRAFGTLPAPTKTGSGDEETWTLLPDGTVLTVNIDRDDPIGRVSAVPGSEKYIPATDTWVSAGATPKDLSFRNGYTDPATGLSTDYDVFEIGPAIVLPNGKLFAVGATGHTALYTPPASAAQTGAWAAGPDMPKDGAGSIQLCDDMPAVLLPSGQVLLFGGPANVTYVNDASGKPIAIDQFGISPLVAFVYDPVTNAVPVPLVPQPPVTQGSARLLLLPTSQVLYTCEQDSTICLLTLDPKILGSADATWKPEISECPACMTPGQTYAVSGFQFNGLSQACSFGDDAQMATNYPIIRLTDATGNVVYAQTFSFSQLGIATGVSPVSTLMQVPAGTPYGKYNLQVIANGIASDAVPVQVAATCLRLLDPQPFVSVDPLSIVLRDDIYIMLKLPNPPPIDVLRREIENAVKGMTAKERESAKMKAKELEAVARAVVKALE